MKAIGRKGSLVGDAVRRRDGIGDGVQLMRLGNAGLAGSRSMKGDGDSEMHLNRPEENERQYEPSREVVNLPVQTHKTRPEIDHLVRLTCL
jgi:hypothetical protein